MVVGKALAAPVLQAVIVRRGKPAVTGFRHGEHQAALTQNRHSHNTVVFGQAHNPHASGRTAQLTDLGFLKPDGHTLLRGHKQLVAAVCLPHPGKHVALVQVDGDQAALSGRIISGKLCAFDYTVIRHHHQVFILVKLGYPNHGGHLLLRLKGEKILDVHSTAGTGTLGNLVALQPVDTAQTGEKQDIVVASGDKEFRGHILIPAGHAGDAPSAPSLQPVGVRFLAFHITEIRQREHAFLYGNQVLDIHFTADGRDLCAAFVAELLLHGLGFVLHNGKASALACKNIQEIGNFLFQACQLFLDFFALQAGELPQAHLYNGLGLHVVQAETFHQRCFAFRYGFGGPQNGDHLVDEVQGNHQAFQNMGPLLGLFQVEPGAPGDDIHLELDVFLQNLPQVQHLRLPVHNSQHDDAEGGLQLGKGEEVVQHDLGRSVPFHIYHNMHAVAVGMVVDIGDALNALFLHQVGDILNQPCLVHLIGQFSDNDLGTARLFIFLNFRPGAHRNLAAARGIGGPNAAPAHHNAPGREVRTLDVLHQLFQSCLRIVDEAAHAVDHLIHVMRRDIGGHAHGDAGRTVDQQVGEMAGQHCGFFQTVVVVGIEIYRVLVDILQHLHGELVHLGLGVSIGRGRVSVYGTEVSVAVHQHVAHGKILGKADHGVVDRYVPMRMVTPQHGAHRIGALAVRFFRPQGIFIHGIEDTPVHRLQAVPYIRQGPLHDDGHGVIQKGFSHLLRDVHMYDAASGFLRHIFRIFKIHGSFAFPVPFFRKPFLLLNQLFCSRRLKARPRTSFGIARTGMSRSPPSSGSTAVSWVFFPTVFTFAP